tara:strand:+ start:787 stop:1032 length:246 start_codon:yes stop_codon:yes gene_type:complete
MKQKKETKWRIYLDNFLVYNLYVLIIGAAFLAVSFILSINGYSKLYTIFQSLWYPIFIPSLSLFFTAILIEATLNQFNSNK